jgi:hypothetical protein
MAQLSKAGKRLGGVALGLCLFATSLAQADSLIYKWTDKNGVVSYSQNPPTEQGARDVTSFKVESLPAAQQRTAKRMLANLEKTTDAEFAAREKRLKQADQKIDAALQRLQKAEHNLTEGSLPTGDDRIGIGAGHARLRDSYFIRVENLQDEVDKAQQALTDAYTARDQI